MSDYPEIAARFQRDTAGHVMTVLHDDGLYRHLRFRRPDRNEYWFDLITWPGCLTVRGDFGDSYTFSHLTDMFEFFRGKGDINPHYWSEKLDSGRSSAQVYSQDAFRQMVWTYVRDEVKDYKGLAKAAQEHFFGEMAEWNTEEEDGARGALDAFTYLPEGQEGEPFRFEDTWEWSFKDFDRWFLGPVTGLSGASRSTTR
jgi:hypothetical protein